MKAAIKRLFKNTVFRLSMLASVLFVASSLVVLGYIYYATVVSELSRIDKEMEAEINELSHIFETQGPAALNQEIFSRVTDLGSSSVPNRAFYVYEYFDARGMPYGGGNLPAKRFFADPEHIPFWRRIPGTDYKKIRVFEYTVPKTAKEGAPMVTRRARGRLKVFKPYSAKLFIARDVEGIMAPAERVTRTLLVAVLIATTLALISGFYVSKRFARRIGNFNRLARAVRAGDLKRRFKRDETGDELDNLAGHLNDMLDHIDRLMMAMRYAGDSIAHDLRSPLTRLRTRLETAASEQKDEEAQIALYSAVEDANELLRTFEGVLRIARLEAGEQREMLVELDPVPLLEDIAELYEPACEDAEIDFALEIEGKHKILADRGLLSQAISNLVENAIKYSPAGQAITVRIRKIRSGRSEISVTDTGPGIPADERERVKERFVRLDKSRTATGSGLGLAFVDAVADLHKAEFKLEDGPGGPDSQFPGLRVSLIFPKVKRN